MDEENKNSVPVYRPIIEGGGVKIAEVFTENVTNRAVNALIEFVKKKSDEKIVLSGTAYMRYLDNAEMHYNQVKTLATGRNPRNVYGYNDIYVETYVSRWKKVDYKDEDKIEVSKVGNLLNMGRKLIIEGTAGTGKSILLRRLFMDAAESGEYIPVLLEFRKLNYKNFEKPVQSSEDCIFDMIRQSMLEFDLTLSEEQFQLSLRTGKYVFLLDGLDEVNHAIFDRVQISILNFSKKYPENPCVITTRPCKALSDALLQNFEVRYICPLTEQQAIQLTMKFQQESDKTREFIRTLNGLLENERYKLFVKNPLMLSVVFLVFMKYNNLYNHLPDFYNSAYDALLSSHDTNEKGFFKRDFWSSCLSGADFKTLFSRFCFQSYFHGKTTFSKREILDILDDSIRKLNLTGADSEEYLFDLQEAVCLIVNEGELYRFSYDAFQYYFSAYYTANCLDDSTQKSFFNMLMSTPHELYWNRNYYYELLMQMEQDRFEECVLGSTLLSIQEKIEKQPESKRDIFFLKEITSSVRFARWDMTQTWGPDINASDESKEELLRYNVTGIFRTYLARVYDIPYNPEQCLKRVNIFRETLEKVGQSLTDWKEYKYKDIDESKKINEEERDKFYSAICWFHRIAETRSAIKEWLLKRRNDKAVPSLYNLIDSF